MEPKEYARIADLLRQISLKIEKNCIPTSGQGAVALMVLNTRLDGLVRALDSAAWLDDRGNF